MGNRVGQGATPRTVPSFTGIGDSSCPPSLWPIPLDVFHVLSCDVRCGSRKLPWRKASTVWLLGGPEWSQGLDSVILMGPLQFGTACNSVITSWHDQAHHGTPAVRPEGLQDPTCRRWRCTSRYQLTLTLNPANRSWSIHQKRAYSGTRAPRYPKHVAVPAEKLQPKGGTGIPISP